MGKKIIFRTIKIIVLVYCLAGIVLFYMQDKLLFHPEPVSADSTWHFAGPWKELTVPYSAGSNINIVQFYGEAAVTRGVVLYFHGNKKNISRYAENAALFTRNNYEVWMIDYPGFGKSTGTFSEQALYDWSLVLYKLARARFAPGEIVIYGKSLGSGVAAQLAAVRDCKRLILETPYYSFPSIVGSWLPFYPVNNMIRFKIPTWSYLEKVTAPVTVFHGTDDWTIPLRNAQKLTPYLKKEDEFIVIENGRHNDLTDFPLFQERLDIALK